MNCVVIENRAVEMGEPQSMWITHKDCIYVYYGYDSEKKREFERFVLSQ